MASLFVVTPLLREAVASCLSLPRLDEVLRASLMAIDASTPALPLALIQQIARAHRAHQSPVHTYVHLLCRGSALFIPPQAGPQRTPEFERYLERLKIKQENEVYERMVRGTKSQKFTLLGDDMNDPNRPQSQSIRSQLSIGVNVIAAMFTGFCAGYYAGRSMFPNSPIWPYVIGMIGIIIAMGVEVWLFIIRDEKEEFRRKRFAPDGSLLPTPSTKTPAAKGTGSMSATAAAPRPSTTAPTKTIGPSSSSSASSMSAAAATREDWETKKKV